MTSLKITEQRLPKAAIGTERRLVSLSFGPEKVNQKVYIQAGLHADEAPGYLVATRLIELLKEADGAGEILQRIVVVPVANPIGLAQWDRELVQGRFDNNDNVNFNRGHDDLTAEIARKITGKLSADSAENVALIRKCCREILGSRQPLTETDQLKNLLLNLSHDADIVLDLHCDHQALVHLYVGTPLWPGCADLAAQMGSAATLLAEDSGGTPFDEANSKIWWELATKFPDHPIPAACLAATVELRGVLDTDPQQTEGDARNLFAFLQRRGYIGGTAPELPELLAEATPLEGVDYIRSTELGILSFLKKPGDTVEKGEVIAEVIDPLEDPAGRLPGMVKKTIKTGTSGILFARGIDRFARPGKIVAKVAGVTPLAAKGANLLTS